VDRADNVPFSVSGIVGGTVTDTFDMLTLDTNVIDDGVNWEDLGYFEVAQVRYFDGFHQRQSGQWYDLCRSNAT